MQGRNYNLTRNYNSGFSNSHRDEVHKELATAFIEQMYSPPVANRLANTCSTYVMTNALNPGYFAAAYRHISETNIQPSSSMLFSPANDTLVAILRRVQTTESLELGRAQLLIYRDAILSFFYAQSVGHNIMTLNYPGAPTVTQLSSAGFTLPQYGEVQPPLLSQDQVQAAQSRMLEIENLESSINTPTAIESFSLRHPGMASAIAQLESAPAQSEGTQNERHHLRQQQLEEESVF